MTRWWMGVLVVLAVAGCKEDLTNPGRCPELCPGDRITVKDTIIAATLGGDSSFFGYSNRVNRQVLLVSDGLAAGEYRSFVVFGKSLRDSVLVDGSNLPFVVDTVAISVLVEIRDTTAKNLRLLLYRIPLTTDTAVGFDSLETFLTPANLLDSAAMSDTLKTGRVEALFAGDKLATIIPPPSDTGRLGIAFRVRADQPTGVRIPADPNFFGGNGPLLEFRGLAVGAVDTSKRRQRIAVRRDSTIRIGYVQNLNRAANPNPDLLYLGGPRSARSLLRFNVPSFIRDTAQILRATLQLTPAMELAGLANSRLQDALSTFGVLADLGAKSPTSSNGAVPRGTLVVNSTQATSIDALSLVATWRGTGGSPSAFFLQHSEELLGGSFMQPVFYSTRSPVGAPTLRITYGVPTKPGQP